MSIAADRVWETTPKYSYTTLKHCKPVGRSSLLNYYADKGADINIQDNNGVSETAY